MKAIKYSTGEKVAIKLIKNLSPYSSSNVRFALREIILLRKLSQIEDNVFTTKLIDIILPKNIIVGQDDVDTPKTDVGDCQEFPDKDELTKKPEIQIDCR